MLIVLDVAFQRPMHRVKPLVVSGHSEAGRGHESWKTSAEIRPCIGQDFCQ